MGATGMGPEPVSVAIVDGDPLSRHGLEGLLSHHGYQVSIGASSIEEFEQEIRRIDADLALVDGRVLADDVRGSLARLQERVPNGQVVVLAQQVETQVVLTCFDRGIDGYLIKTADTEPLLAALTLVRNGERVYPSDMLAELVRAGVPSLNDRTLSHELGESLSAREREILEMLMDGASNKEMANRLDIAEATVKVHVQRMLKRLNVDNRTQAAVWAATRMGSGTPPVEDEGGA